MLETSTYTYYSNDVSITDHIGSIVTVRNGAEIERTQYTYDDWELTQVVTTKGDMLLFQRKEGK